MAVEKSMENGTSRRLSRDDWLNAALNRCKSGINEVKVAPLAEDMGVTTGSFYWHFKNRRELLDALLEYWERETTDVAIDEARQFDGPPADRILFIMEAIVKANLAKYDLPIWHWAQSDANAKRVFQRVLRKRFSFAAWMFSEAGFPNEDAEVRGRMMVVYLMGEATLVPESMARRKESLKLKHAILTAAN